MSTQTQHRILPMLLPRRRLSGKRALVGIASWGVLLGWMFVALAPIVWLLLAVTKSELQLSTDPGFTFGSLSQVRTAMSDLLAYRDGVFLTWLWNSVVITGGTIAASVLITVPAAYGLGTFRFRGRKALLMVTMALMLLPQAAMVLPLFLEMNLLGLLGTRWAVILPQALYPFGLYVGFIFFSTGDRREIYDAARLDGCSEWQVFRHIGIPLAKPMIALVVFFSFMRTWNQYVLPLLLLTDSTYPLPVGLSLMASSTPMLSGANAIGGIKVSTLLLATVFTMGPALIGIMLAQRTIVRGADSLGGGLRG